jgi:hypothetical protein
MAVRRHSHWRRWQRRDRLPSAPDGRRLRAGRDKQSAKLECAILPAIRWAALANLLCLAGCNFGFLRDEVVDGPYRLVAVDSPEDMILCRSIGTEGACLGDTLPGPTVFQAGWNSNYIVVARHPRRWPAAADRSISEFYYIVRQAEDRDATRPVSVMGPFNELAYEQEKRRLQLPAFTKVFRYLK